jgi:hypothetical protein
MDNIASRKPGIVIVAAVASAHTSSPRSATDKNKIADALRAGSSFVTRRQRSVGRSTTSAGARLAGLTNLMQFEEVIDWLHEPTQAGFVEREGLDVLLH